MSLLAYSLRRAWGALLVALIVIWLIQLGVYHIALPPLRGIEVFPDGVEAWIRAQPALAAEWTTAALEVGIAAVVALGLVGLWKLRPNTPRLWALFATGTVLLAFGLASFGVALANQDYRRLNVKCPPQAHGCVPPAIVEGIARQYNRGINPAPWWIAGGVSTGLGMLLLAGAVWAPYRKKRLGTGIGTDLF